MALTSFRWCPYQLIGASWIRLVIGALTSTTIGVVIIIAIIPTILATFTSIFSLFINNLFCQESVLVDHILRFYFAKQKRSTCP